MADPALPPDSGPSIEQVAFAGAKPQDRRQAIRQLARDASDEGLAAQAQTLALLEIARQLSASNHLAALQYESYIEKVENDYGSTTGRERAWKRSSDLRELLRKAMNA